MKFNIFAVLIATILNIVLADEQIGVEPLETPNSSFQDCFDVFTRSMNALTKDFAEKVESCYKLAEQRKAGTLEKFEVMRSININKTEGIDQKFTECASKINLEEYTTCIVNLVNYNSKIMEDIADQDEEFSEDVVENKIEEYCVSSSLGNIKNDNLAIFDKFYECMSINPYK